MVRTNEYPSRPGKTAKQECDVSGKIQIPQLSHKEDSVTKQNYCYINTSILANVAKLKDGIKKTDIKTIVNLFLQEWNIQRRNDNVIYDKIENLLNAVLNRDNAVFTEIKVLSGYNEEGIYDKYFAVYHM